MRGMGGIGYHYYVLFTVFAYFCTALGALNDADVLVISLLGFSG